ncbi:MAG: carbohydrate ABC transporter substrate-binding protein, partial [Clostridiales bacterium]|nr:carbohydrate ABC transporter substrate-binding protein [Clostridiales bacterium]
DEKDSLFYVSHDGIYRYAFGGSVVEQVADGKLNSLSSPDIAFTDMARDKDGSFYLAVSDMSQGDSMGRICKYVYSKDTPAVPDTELTVYSLADDDFLRQAAAAFQKKYPDIYLNLETGMTGEDAVTETDALKALNTEIMAGKGPDILLMDGIAADTYIEKGMLEDLSGILKDADILENIIEPYKDGEGKIYQMPVKFGIPYIQGKKEYVDAISDLTSMADTIESHKEEYTKDTLPFSSSYSPYMLLKGLAAVNMSAWVNEDGTLNQEAVQGFLEQANRIYQSAKAPAEEQLASFGTTVEEMEEANEVRKLYSEFGAVFSQFGVGGLSLISGSNILGTGGVYSPSDLRSIYSVEQQGDSISGKLWNGQTKDAFIPQKLVGISAKSSEKEAAEKFVSYLFSDEGQRVGSSNGLPVRKSVYEDVSYWMGNAKEGDVTSVTSSYNNQTGESVDLNIVQPGEAVIREMQELGKTLTTPVKENRMILSAVLDAGASYLKGEISVEEAVEKAASQVNLYLSE